eukprot:scaffold115189_cov30-Tisochrysis_lutea.AAC.1
MLQWTEENTAAPVSGGPSPPTHRNTGPSPFQWVLLTKKACCHVLCSSGRKWSSFCVKKRGGGPVAPCTVLCCAWRQPPSVRTSCASAGRSAGAPVKVSHIGGRWLRR